VLVTINRKNKFTWIARTMSLIYFEYASHINDITKNSMIK